MKYPFFKRIGLTTLVLSLSISSLCSCGKSKDSSEDCTDSFPSCDFTLTADDISTEDMSTEYKIPGSDYYCFFPEEASEKTASYVSCNHDYFHLFAYDSSTNNDIKYLTSLDADSSPSYMDDMTESGILNEFDCTYYCGTCEEGKRFFVAYQLDVASDEYVYLYVSTNKESKMEEAKEYLDSLLFTVSDTSVTELEEEESEETDVSDDAVTDSVTEEAAQASADSDIENITFPVIEDNTNKINKEDLVYVEGMTINGCTCHEGWYAAKNLSGMIFFYSEKEVEITNTSEPAFIRFDWTDATYEPASIVVTDEDGRTFHQDKDEDFGRGTIVFKIDNPKAQTYTVRIKAYDPLGTCSVQEFGYAAYMAAFHKYD